MKLSFKLAHHKHGFSSTLERLVSSKVSANEVFFSMLSKSEKKLWKANHYLVKPLPLINGYRNSAKEQCKGRETLLEPTSMPQMVFDKFR